MANIYPSITARKAFQARARIGAALNAFYAPQYGQNEDAAEMTRARARVLRNYDVPVQSVGSFEIALLHVATTNTIPTTFWFTVLTWEQPKIVARVRDEMQSVVELTHDADGKRVATIDISVLEGRCPYLVAAYREAIRASNHQLGQRMVMRDTEISDGEGRTYLLKEGTNLVMPAGVSHMMADIWGGETEDFDPDRFYDVKPEMERKRKQGYVPFGGGKHLVSILFLPLFSHKLCPILSLETGSRYSQLFFQRNKTLTRKCYSVPAVPSLLPRIWASCPPFA